MLPREISRLRNVNISRALLISRVADNRRDRIWSPFPSPIQITPRGGFETLIGSDLTKIAYETH